MYYNLNLVITSNFIYGIGKMKKLIIKTKNYNYITLDINLCFHRVFDKTSGFLFISNIIYRMLHNRASISINNETRAVTFFI